jgi:hypothetical protein
MRPAFSDEVNAMVVFVAGDTWNGFPSITVSNRIAPGDLASVKMAFKLNPKSTMPTLELTSGNADITISDPVNWVFTINPGRYELPIGQYVWQIETTDDSTPSAYVETLMEGIGEVLSNYTTTT